MNNKTLQLLSLRSRLAVICEAIAGLSEERSCWPMHRIDIETPREVEDGLVRPPILARRKSYMAAIDYATCGFNDVIAHSLKLHPHLLSDRLRFYARVHAQFADAYGDCEVTRNERDLADRLYSFANAISLGDYTMPGDVDVRHEAFICAAGLQSLHPIMQKAIAGREDARNARPARSD